MRFRASHRRQWRARFRSRAQPGGVPQRLAQAREGLVQPEPLAVGMRCVKVTVPVGGAVRVVEGEGEAEGEAEGNPEALLSEPLGAAAEGVAMTRCALGEAETERLPTPPLGEGDPLLWRGVSLGVAARRATKRDNATTRLETLAWGSKQFSRVLLSVTHTFTHITA